MKETGVVGFLLAVSDLLQEEMTIEPAQAIRRSDTNMKDLLLIQTGISACSAFDRTHVFLIQVALLLPLPMVWWRFASFLS